MPYDWKTVSGFSITTFVELLIDASYVVMLMTWLLVHVGISQFLVTLSRDIQFNLNEINDEILLADSAKKLELIAKLNKIVEFHSISLK